MNQPMDANHQELLRLVKAMEANPSLQWIRTKSPYVWITPLPEDNQHVATWDVEKEVLAIDNTSAYGRLPRELQEALMDITELAVMQEFFGADGAHITNPPNTNE